MIEQLRSQFGEVITSAEEVDREVRVYVLPHALLEVARFCDTHGYRYPADITAVDTGEALRMVYRLFSFSDGNYVVLNVILPRSGARVASLSGLFGAADWLEREVYDLFGVRFDGHPNLCRILLTDDWEGHPLLKASKK